MNRLLLQRESFSLFLFFPLVFLSLREKNTNSMEVSNIGNVVAKAMLKGRCPVDSNTLKTPVIDS